MSAKILFALLPLKTAARLMSASKGAWFPIITAGLKSGAIKHVSRNLIVALSIFGAAFGAVCWERNRESSMNLVRSFKYISGLIESDSYSKQLYSMDKHYCALKHRFESGDWDLDTEIFMNELSSFLSSYYDKNEAAETKKDESESKVVSKEDELLESQIINIMNEDYEEQQNREKDLEREIDEFKEIIFRQKKGKIDEPNEKPSLSDYIKNID